MQVKVHCKAVDLQNLALHACCNTGKFAHLSISEGMSHLWFKGPGRCLKLATGLQSLLVWMSAVALLRHVIAVGHLIP